MRSRSVFFLLVWASILCGCFPDQPQQEITSDLPKGESGIMLGMSVEQFRNLKISYVMMERGSVQEYRINEGIPKIRTASLGFNKKSHTLQNLYINYDDVYSTRDRYDSIVKEMQARHGDPAKRENGAKAFCVWQDKSIKVTVGFHSGVRADLYKEYRILGK